MGQFEPDEGTEEVEITLSGETDEVAPDADEAPAEDAVALEDQPADEPDSFARMEEINKGLDKLRKHVAKRVGEILGDDAPFYTECELCTPFGVPGLRPPVDLPPDVQAHLYHLLGQRSPTDLRPDPHSEECPECAGQGANKMPTHVPDQEQATCVRCSGKGWLATDSLRGTIPGVPPNGDAPSYPPFSADVPTLPAVASEDEADVKSLRDRGYMVFPMPTPAG